jgi:hypothetical protein
LRACLVGLVVLLLPCAAPASGAAQTVTNLPDSARQLRSGRTIFVSHGDGEQTEGQFIRVTPEAIIVSVKGAERTIPADTVHRIDRRDSVWNGAIIGGAVLGLPGMAGAGASCSPNCGSAMTGAAIVFGAIGAGIGALVDRGISGRSPVYIARVAAAPVPAPSPVAPPTALPPGWLPSLGQLSIRVAPEDKIEVVDRTGASRRGRFVRSSATSVTLLVDKRTEEISSTSVRRVNRMGHYAGRGALIGLIAGGTVDLVACATVEGGCGPGATYGGALWGTIIGRFIPKRTVVYDPDVTPNVASWQLIPVLTQTRTSLVMSVRF